MNFTRGIAKGFVWTGLLLCCARLGAELPERKTFQFGEYTIEASAGDEAYVEALAKKLADYQPPAASPPPPPPRLSVADLEKRKDYFLGKVCAQLGLAKPTEVMTKAFSGSVNVLDGLGEMGSISSLGLPRKFSLWRRPELLERISAGETVAGFTKDAEGGLKFNFNPNFESKPGATREEKRLALAEGWSALAWPVKIAMKPDQTPEQDVGVGLQEYQKFSEGMISLQSLQLQRSSVHTVLHEAVEAGVVWHHLTSKDRRWFCDGVANYVAWKILRDELGPEEAKQYYDLEAELKKYAAFAPTVDLLAWPAAENLKQASYAKNLNIANYAFATKVIADVCAKHGDSILPRLFIEIGKTPREKATMETVYRAFKKLTREDLLAYLPKPGSKR